MKRKSIVTGPLLRARTLRLIAKCIDLGLVTIGAVFYYPMGLILGIVYLCIADSLYDGQSIGKRLMGFGVVSLIDGSPCSTKQSFVRNLPFTVPLFFLIFPFGGWIFSAVFALPIALMEFYLLFKAGSAHRLGDIMADTTVIANDGTRLDLRKTKNPWFDSPPIPMQ
ncbi:MAG: RDD family protein [Bacteriovoracaceae bacterium]